MALRTSSSMAEISVISPLRTPRERAWPSPIKLTAPPAFTSPTTATTLDVPISSPTIKEAGSNISPAFPLGVFHFRRNLWHRARLDQAERHIVAHGQIE